jgi:hypothetical protein
LKNIVLTIITIVFSGIGGVILTYFLPPNVNPQGVHTEVTRLNEALRVSQSENTQLKEKVSELEERLQQSTNEPMLAPIPGVPAVPREPEPTSEVPAIEGKYLESDIMGELTDLYSHPLNNGALSFLLGFSLDNSDTVFNGISTGSEKIGIAVYNIEGQGFTMLSGKLGTTNWMGIPGVGTAIILADGSVIGQYTIDMEEDSYQIDVPIPQGTNNIEIRLQPGGGYFDYASVGFGAAYFS